MNNEVKKFVVTALTASTIAVTAIMGFESSGRVITTAYSDVAGISTICAGHTRGVFKGMQVSPKQCEIFLKEDLSYEGKALARLVKVPLSQGQYDSILSLSYNIGAGNLAKSSLLKYLNTGQCTKAANEFLKWDKARVGGKLKVLPGLTKRRLWEYNMFIKDC